MRYVAALILCASFLMPSVADAARLWSSGCELQGDSPGNMTDNLEWDISGEIASNTSISGTVFRSGLSSCRINLITDDWGELVQQFSSASETTDLYFRFYFRVADMSAERVDIMQLEAAADGDEEGVLALNTDATLSWYDDDFTLLGTSASALSLDTWYRIEVNYDAADGVEVRVDGTQVISIGAHDGDGVGDLTLGACVNSAVGAFCGGDGWTSSADYFFDDVAINDTSGAAQTSWPGAGSIVHMQPDSAGDNNNCSSGTFADVDEVTPDDDTTYCVLDADTGGDILDVNVETASSAGIDSYDTVTLVHVGGGERQVSAAAASLEHRVKSASGGTTSTGTSYTHDDTTYRTNGDVAPRNYKLTSYTDPTTGIAWTPTGTNSLDNMQIGMNCTDCNPDTRVTTIWALVEYIDGSPPGATERMRARLNGGRVKISGGRIKLQSN